MSMARSSINPKLDSFGVGFCSADECAEFDGKRCSLLGRPVSGICEEWARRTAIDLENMKLAISNKN
jgi:hypothetical protein